MARDSDIIPSSLPPAAQNAAVALRISGLVVFWANIFFGILSAAALVAAFVSGLGGKNNIQAAGLGGVGLFCAICGIAALGVSIYFARRYINIGRALRTLNTSNRPRRVDTKNLVRMGLIVNLVGMTFALFGTQAAVGNVLVKTFQQTGALVGGQSNCNVVPADALSVQANTTAVFAHFIGTIISIWLLAGVMSKHHESILKSYNE